MGRINDFFISRFKNNIPLLFRRIFNNNKEPVIISRDCIGGIVYKQYNMRFYSPTINLYFNMNDFNYFCNNLESYLRGFFENGNGDVFPIGLLHAADSCLPVIKINFVHYNNYEEAIEKWNIRKNRCLSRLNNVYVINNCTNEEEILEVDLKIINNFNLIHYKKVIFVRKTLGFDNEFVVTPINDYSQAFILERYNKSWKRVFNNFSFNKFLRR